jgi:hypothetical protein
MMEPRMNPEIDPMPTPPVQPAEPRRCSFRPWLLAGLLLVALCAALAMWGVESGWVTAQLGDAPLNGGEAVLGGMLGLLVGAVALVVAIVIATLATLGGLGITALALAAVLLLLSVLTLALLSPVLLPVAATAMLLWWLVRRDTRSTRVPNRQNA